MVASGSADFALPLTDGVLDALPTEARERVAELWRRRADNERGTSATFALLLRSLGDQGAVEPVLELARHAVSDELRHGELCDVVADRYAPRGTLVAPEASSESPLAAPEAPAFHGCTAAESALLFVVLQCCLNETIAAAYLRTCLERAHGSVARAAVRALLADEVKHSRLGWAHLASECVDDAGRRLVADAMPELLRTITRIWLADPEGLHARAPEGHGSLPLALVESVVRDTVEALVVPGLAHVGVESRGAEAWLAAARAAAHVAV